MPQIRFFLALLLVTAPSCAAAADCELQLDLTTPVSDYSGMDPQGGALPDVSTGFPAVTIGVFSGDLDAVAGDNRCGLALQYDRARWLSHDFSTVSLLVAWRQALVPGRAWGLWLSLYAGPSWYDVDYESTRQLQHLGILDIVWKVAPAAEFTLPVDRGTALVAGLRYVQHLNSEPATGPFESGLVCYVGAGLRLN